MMLLNQREKDILKISGTSKVDNEYSKAYLRHLIISNELLGKQIASIHNLSFYINLMKLSNEEISRYTRHLTLPEVGMEGQIKIKAAKVLKHGKMEENMLENLKKVRDMEKE